VFPILGRKISTEREAAQGVEKNRRQGGRIQVSILRPAISGRARVDFDLTNNPDSVVVSKNSRAYAVKKHSPLFVQGL